MVLSTTTKKMIKPLKNKIKYNKSYRVKTTRSHRLFQYNQATLMTKQNDTKICTKMTFRFFFLLVLYLKNSQNMLLVGFRAHCCYLRRQVYNMNHLNLNWFSNSKL
jgi:hypothetical protein